MKKTTRTLLILTALTLFISVFMLFASAAGEPQNRSVDIDGLYYNLSLENDMSINLAIPSEYIGDGLVETVEITVGSVKTTVEGKPLTINGKSYYVVTYSGINVMRADETVSFKLTNSTHSIEKTVELSPVEYAIELLYNTTKPVEEELARSILAYVLSAERYFKGDAETIERIEEVLSVMLPPEEITSFGTSLDTSALAATALSGAYIDFIDATPAFVIELDSGAPRTSITVSYVNYNGQPVRKNFTLSQSNKTARISGMKICDFDNPLTITVGGTDYSYNLVTYLNNIAQSSSTKSLANAIWNYVQAANTYKLLASKGFIKYSEFGADVTGQTDSYEAIWKAHEFANANHLRVEADLGATYYIGVQSIYTDTNVSDLEKEIQIKTDTDWKNAKFIIDNRAITAQAYSANSKIGAYNLFRVAPELEMDYYAANYRAAKLAAINSAISSFTKGSCPNVGLTFKQDVLLLIKDTKNSIYKTPNGEAEALTELILVHKDGTVDESTPLMFDYSNTTLTRVEVYSADETPVSVYGGEFTTLADSSAGEVLRGIEVERANTTLSGIVHRVEGESKTETGRTSGFFVASNTCNVTFEKCVMSAHRPVGSFETGASNSNNIKWINCTQFEDVMDEDFSGIMSSNFSKNLTYENSVLSGFDAHKGAYNVTVKNSTIGHGGITIDGGGTALFKGTTVMNKGYTNASNTNSFINLRGDYGSNWDGDIIINDCEVSMERGTIELIRTDWSFHDFGYDCHLPSVYIDGMTCYFMNGGVKTEVSPNSIYIFRNFRSLYDTMPEVYGDKTYNGSIFAASGTDEDGNPLENKNVYVLPDEWESKNFDFYAWISGDLSEWYADFTSVEKSRDDAVIYSDFGADVTGMTDSYEAILKAHKYANEHGLRVLADVGATYYIGLVPDKYISGAYADRRIPIKTDTDWKDAQFIIDDTGMYDAATLDKYRHYDVFFVTPTKSSYTLDLSKVTIDPEKFKPGSTNIGIKFSETVMINVENANKQVYKRTNGQSSNMQDLIVVDKDGNIIDKTALTFDYGEVTKITVYSAADTPITIKGGIFYSRANRVPTSTYGYSTVYRGIQVERSNTTIEGVQHYMIDEPTTEKSSMPYGGFYSARYANNVTFKDCTVTGHRVYQNALNGSWNGTYDISATSANRVSWLNCNQKMLTNVDNDLDRDVAAIIEDLKDATVVDQSITYNGYWGVIGTNFSRNLTLDNCRFSRFDAHSGVYNVTITNSEIGYQTLNMVGNGDAYFENTTVHGGSFISLRADYGATWNGNITIKNCALRVGDRDTSAPLIAAGWQPWDFGYECHLPNVYVDGFKVYRPNGDEATDIEKCVFYGIKSAVDRDLVNVFAEGKIAEAAGCIDNINPLRLPQTVTVIKAPTDNWVLFNNIDGIFNDAEKAEINKIHFILN